MCFLTELISSSGSGTSVGSEMLVDKSRLAPKVIMSFVYTSEGHCLRVAIILEAFDVKHDKYQRLGIDFEGNKIP